MLKTRRDGAKVKVDITVYVPTCGYYTYTLTWDASPNQDYAGFLVNNIDNSIFKKLQQIREAAYEDGWNDHKKRRPKATYFKGVW